MLALASGELFHQENSLASLIDSRNIYLALDAVDTDALPAVGTEGMETFFGLHIVEPAPDDQTHVHGLLDGCCAAGGLVCDAGLALAAIPVPLLFRHPSHCTQPVSNLSGIATPPLYHPPKA